MMSAATDVELDEKVADFILYGVTTNQTLSVLATAKHKDNKQFVFSDPSQTIYQTALKKCKALLQKQYNNIKKGKSVKLVPLPVECNPNVYFYQNKSNRVLALRKLTALEHNSQLEMSDVVKTNGNGVPF